MGKISQTGRGGLTQTHYLMSPESYTHRSVHTSIGCPDVQKKDQVARIEGMGTVPQSQGDPKILKRGPKFKQKGDQMETLTT